MGIDEIGERVYRLLLAEPATGSGRLAERLGLPEDEVREALRGLAELGLVRLHRDSGGHPAAWPVHPARAFDPLLARVRRELRQREQGLELAEATVDELTDLAGQGPAPDSAEVRVNRGTAAAYNCLEHIAATARTRVFVLAAAGPAPGITDPTDYRPVIDLAVRLAERDVPLRVIMLDSISYLTPLVEGAQRMRRAGVEIRTSPVLPAWTFVVDDEYVVTAVDPDDHERGSVLVHTPGAVAAATDLFRMYWENATPLDGSPPRPTQPLTPGQRRLLIMIANGGKDETVARRFSVSTRTVRRMIAELYELAGVSSRIQLVFRAAQLGWLDGSELDRI